MFTLDQLHEAADLVRAHVPPTPQFAWPLLADRTGAEVWVKHENHTPAGAFKLRGGLVYLDDLARGAAASGRPVPGIATATRGNHGQSIPFAARPHGIPVRVWVPHGNSVEKNAAARAWGAEVIEHGHDFEAARAEAMRVAADEGLHPIGPFHPLLVRGVATYALEFLSAQPDLHTVYAPIGMGSGACGLIAARDLLGLKTEIVGVVAAAAPAYALSFEAGRVVATETAPTFADGVACRAPSEEALDVLLKGAARIVRVTEDGVAEAMRALHADTHNMAESAGAVALAGLMAERDRMRGRRVGVILSGGNVDATQYAKVLAGETPAA
ncbi:MAG: threonine dehydratase [Pseudomonadota bacterium]|nr:threonine dehydratase [Pseudomonadota bacterium]